MVIGSRALCETDQIPDSHRKILFPAALRMLRPFVSGKVFLDTRANVGRHGQAPSRGTLPNEFKTAFGQPEIDKNILHAQNLPFLSYTIPHL